MSEQADLPEDKRAAQAAQKARKEAIAAEKAKLDQDDKDKAKAKANQTKARDKQWADDDALAKTLTAPSTFQQGVTSRLMGKTTEQLGAMIRHCAAKRDLLQWLSVSKPIARDVMQRAYPLALQMGIMTVPNEQQHYMRFANGSVIDFSWPGKPALAVSVPPP